MSGVPGVTDSKILGISGGESLHQILQSSKVLGQYITRG